MPDLRLPEAAWGNPHGRVMKRKRPDINFDIAIDADSQVNHFKHQKNTDGHDSIDLTPSHRILDVLGSAATESARKISTREPQPSLPSAPMLGTQSHPVSKLARPQFPAPLRRSQSSQPVPIEGKVIQKWDSKEWDGDEFDSDDENMSLAVTMKLATELSLLKSFLETYRKFNIHLGEVVSGPRHKGFLSLISSTVGKIESHTTHLRTLRNEKQRGDPTPSVMELIAEKIARRCKSRRKYLWEIMEEKVDMTDDVARAVWVKKKKAMLGDVMGGLVGYLAELGEEEGWKEREVREMGEKWEKRWKTFGAMDREDLKKAGWILEVGKRDV